MSLGPIELIVFGFPDGTIDPAVREQVKQAIEHGGVQLVDALLIRKSEAGEVSFVELDELTDDAELLAVASALTDGVDLLSADDADELAADLVPGAAALALFFERTRLLPLFDAVAASGGGVVADFHIPAVVVDEVVVAVEAL